MSELDQFCLKDNDLSFLISDKISCEDYLWSQIELSANESKFELCEALLQIWFNKRSHFNKSEAKQTITNFLLNCFKQNDKNENIWFIYRIFKYYNLENLLNQKELEIKLILRNSFNINESQINDLLIVSKCDNLSSIDDKVIITLRNFILNEPKIAQILIDLFNESKSYNHLYSQCLIHALKNDNKSLLLDILSVFPDEEIDKNVKLFEEVCDQFSSVNNDEDRHIISLYKSALLRKSSKLIELFSNVRRLKNKELLYDCENHRFNFKECFLLAANDRKHFISQLLEDKEVLYDLPPKQRLYFLIYALHKKDLKIERFIRIENEINKLVFDCDEISVISKSDLIIKSLIKRLRFISNFTKWCIDKLEINTCNNNNLHTMFSIFQSLVFSESPLKILSKHGFLSNKYELKDNLIEEICDLLSDYDESELMIYRGFLAIRFTIMWIILTDNDNEDNNFEDQIISLLKKIYPISFRVEVLENIFSLLFLTQNELIDNENEEDDYSEETVVNKEFTSMMATLNTPTLTTPTISLRATYFLCPNSLVPQLLSLLKDAIFDTQAALFAYNYKKKDEIPIVKLESSIKNLSECKVRVETLMKYVSEAQWRYSVIEPAFHKNTSLYEKKKIKTNPLVDENEVESEEIVDEPEFLRGISSASGSDNEKKPSKQIFSSLISCMLASPTQLLRYSLLEGQIDRAKQVVKLFEHCLKDTEEVKELEIIDKWKELTLKLKSLSTPEKSMNVSKIGEIAATGLRTTQIQSVIHELLLELNISDLTKNSIVIDFALTSSPSIDVSEIILDAILHNQNASELFPEKINSLVVKMRSMINDLSKEYDNKSTSFSTLLTDYIEKENFWDSNAFREQKRVEKQLKIAYQELHKYLIDLESQNDFEPTLSPINHTSDSKKTSVLFEKLLRLCPSGKFQYMRTLFYYVRKVSKALYECRRRSNSSTIGYSDTSYFSILQQSPSAILCSMILKDGISPKFADDFAKEMKVDLIGTLCSVLCPSIPSHFLTECMTEFFLTESCHPALCELIEVHLRGIKHSNADLDSLMIQNHFEDELDSPNRFVEEKIRGIDLINYFKIRSPILVELMKLLRLIKDDINSNSDLSFKANSPLSKWIEIVREKFGCAPLIDLTSIISLALYPRITSGHNIVVKTLEHHAIKLNLLEMYDLFKYIEITNSDASSFGSTNSSFKTLKNAILSRLAVEQEDVKYALQIIDNPQTKCDLIIDLIDISNQFDSAYTAIRTIKSCLSSLTDEVRPQDLGPLRDKLNGKCLEIEFYSRMGQLSGLRSWKDAKHNLNGIDILTIIKTKRKYSMAVEWFTIRSWETETTDLQYELLILAHCEQSDFKALSQILSTLDANQSNSLSLIGKVLNAIEDFRLRHFIIEYILEHYSKRLNEEQLQYYNNYSKGIKLIQTLDPKTRCHYMNIITKPLLIMEQMLMNIEYEALEEATKNLKLIYIDFLIEIYAQKAVEIQIYDISSAAGSVISDVTLISSTVVESKPTPFFMPEYIPTKEQWIPDSKVSHCMLCKIEMFSMLNRRHHCRRCGRVVCGNCSQNTLMIPEIATHYSVRVCDECYIQTQRNNRRESSVSNSSSLNKPMNTVWILTCDDLQNDSIRMEFYYESAPSVSLCLTLLKLHSDKNRCCKVIVDSICKPLLETVVSSQVDYGLVIGMIRSLLVSTRISMEEEKSELIEQLDFLLGRLDVIRMLINSNCNTKEIISYALCNPVSNSVSNSVSNNDNSILKLQEKLIEMERFELARDLATKFGLDSKSIWKTWAFICLKHCRFDEARDKFKQVFDINKSAEGNRILVNIIEVLSKHKSSSNLSLREKCLQIKREKLKTNESINGTNDLDSVNSKVYNEIMYYLKEYGNKEDIIKFHVQNSMWKQSIDLFLNESSILSNYNIFIKELFMPAVKRGALSQFLSCLKMLDPSLNRIWKCLFASCKYLNNNHMYRMLHILQVFMSDHLRAAITQINCLYLKPSASDYMELNKRIQHLQQAKQHCRDFLYLSSNEYRSGCLVMEKEDVMKQMRTLNLQIDITMKFNEKQIKGFLPIAISSVDTIGKDLMSPPTILDHSKARKTELTALVIISYGSLIVEGFTVAQMIIKDHNLDSAQVYRLAGRALVQMPQINVIDSLSQLLECIRASAQTDTTLCDDVIGACIRSSSNPTLIEPLIKLLSSDINKIDAYILSGKLKSAYLLAINLNRDTDVTRVLESALRSGDQQIRKICEMWLKKKAK